jgi:uncharacterized alpha-E superfamily protein
MQTNGVVSCWKLSRAQQRRLATRLRAHPYAFVAQAQVAPSTVPVWNGDTVQSYPVVLRAYVVASAGGYMVMPGGLTRVSAAAGAHDASMQRGGRSKDTWVISAGPLRPLSVGSASRPPIELRRSGYDLPSRVADNLFWLGRYAERTENAVRLLRSVLTRLTSETGLSGSAALPAVLQVLRDTWNMASGTASDGAQASLGVLEQTLLRVMFDPQWPDSVRTTLTTLHRVASRVRDRISLDSWSILNCLDQDFTRPQSPGQVPLSEALELLNHTIVTLAAFSGLGMENMTRGPGWRFLDMGRRLERAIYTVGLLRGFLLEVREHEAAVLEMLLEIADSAMTYRSRYLTTLQCAPVLDLLLTDDTNPRSVAYQLVVLDEHVEHLPRDHVKPLLGPAPRLMLTLLTRLRLVEIEGLCDIGSDGSRWQLETLLAHLMTDLPVLSDIITHHYLSHTEPSRHLATSGFAGGR